MTTQIPYKKVIKLALTTTPFFGIMGAMPGFIIGDIQPARILAGMLFIMLFASLIWIIHLSLLQSGSKLQWLGNKRVRFVIACLISSVFVAILFNLITQSGFIQNLPSKVPPFPLIPFSNRFIIAPLTQSLAINVVIFVLIELLQLREQKNKVSLENEQLKLANMEAKINSLKEQLHPHFLFNSLSTLRSLISRSPEKAELYLEQLSELLRFSTNNSKAVISLAHEVQLCTSYLHMQKVRFGDSLDFKINIPEHLLSSVQVPVYSLQQLAENAIKHNILTRELPLTISIYYHAFSNEIITSNNLQPRESAPSAGSTGLANLNERYLLLGYPGINITKSESKFTVGIQLIPNESSNH